MADPFSVEMDSLSEFLAGARDGLERALVARFGVDEGLEASAAAVEYAVRCWDRVRVMDNPAGYLYRVGETAGRRNSNRRRRQTSLMVESTVQDQVVDIDLQRALMRLKPIQRVAVVLVHAHGHSYVEASEIVGVSVSTFNNHLHRGLARLRQELEK